MHKTLSIVTLCAAALLAWQDPPSPAKPASAQDPVKQEPATAAPEDKEPKSAPKRHRYEGVYRLRSVMVAGAPETDQKQGYLAITGRHLFLVVAADGPVADQPVVSAGVRRWKEELGGISTTVELDFFNDHNGALHFAPPGLPEVRGIELVRGGLRLLKDATTWMDFERIE
ncbi:MAG: hypothetical protein R3F29_04735 [Planctomycetota bacterium]